MIIFSVTHVVTLHKHYEENLFKTQLLSNIDIITSNFCTVTSQLSYLNNIEREGNYLMGFQINNFFNIFLLNGKTKETN